MADQANFYIKNSLQQGITVTCYANGVVVGTAVSLAYQEEQKFYIAGTDMTLVIQGPSGMDIKDCPIFVRADIDLNTVVSRTNSTWTMSIVPNTLDPISPTDVNVNVGVIPV